MPATLRLGAPIWAALLAEFVLVVVAVFLALAAGQWADGRRAARNADAAVARIATEMAGNRRYLIIAIDQHQKTLDDLDARLAAMQALDIATATDEEIAAAGSITPFRPWRAAWRLAEGHGDLAHVDPDVAFKLTAAYERQDLYATYGAQYLSVAFDLNYRDEARADAVRDAIAQVLYTLLLLERSLLEAYDEALAAVAASP